MKIEAHRVRIETDQTNNGKDMAIMDVSRCIFGVAASIAMLDVCNGAFYLAVREDQPGMAYLLALPSTAWKGDARNDGYTIIQQINHKALNEKGREYRAQEAAVAAQPRQEGAQ